MDYIYKIKCNSTNQVYIGQSAQKYGSDTRLKEHFYKVFAGKKDEAADVIKNQLLSDITVYVYPGPLYGLSEQVYLDFNKFFVPSGKRLERTTVKTEASKTTLIWKDVMGPLTAGQQEMSQKTIGDILDIAEILHIFHAIQIGEKVVNTEMGGQRTAWCLRGSSTRVFKKSDSPQTVYSTILQTSFASLNFMQQIADQVSQKWFENNSNWSDVIDNIFSDKEVLKVLQTGNNTLGYWKKIVQEKFFQYLRTTTGASKGRSMITSLRKTIEQELKESYKVNSLQDFGLEWKTTQQSTKEIVELFTDVVRHKLKKIGTIKIKNNKKVRIISIDDVFEILNRDLKFQSTKDSITVPITMLLKPVVTVQNSSNQWYNFSTQNMQLDPLDLKKLSLDIFKSIYREIVEPDFYKEKQLRTFQDINNQTFSVYNYNGTSEQLSFRMRDEYALRGLRAYTSMLVWPTFFASMYANISKGTWQEGVRKEDSKIFWWNSRVYVDNPKTKKKVKSNKKNKKRQRKKQENITYIAHFFTEDQNPISLASADKIKIY